MNTESPSNSTSPAGQTVSLTSNPALSTLQASVETACHLFIERWQGGVHSLLATVDSALDTAEAQLAREGQDRADRRNTVVTMLQTVLSSIDQLPSLATEPALVHTWRNEWHAAVDAVPETVTLADSRQAWLDGAGSGLAAGLWRTVLSTLRLPRPTEPGGDQLQRDLPLRACVQELAARPVEDLAETLASAHISAEMDWLESLREGILDVAERFGLRSELGPGHEGSVGGAGDGLALTALRNVTRNGREQVDELADEQRDTLPEQIREAFSELTRRWPYAGTARLRLPSQPDEAVARAARATDTILDRRRSRLRGLHGNVGKDLRLTVTIIRHAGIALGHADRLRRQVDETLRSEFSQIRDAVTRALTTAADREREDESLAGLKQTGERLRAELRYRRMPAAMNALIEFGIDSTLNDYLKNNRSLLANMPETEPVYTGAQALSAARIHQVPFREIVRRGAFADAEQALRGLKQELETERGGIVRGISELDDVLDVNISAGISLVDREHDDDKRAEAYETALKGFDRVAGRVRELDSKAHKFADSAIQRFLATAGLFEEQFAALTDNHDLLQLRLKLMQGEVRGRYVRRGQRFFGRVLGRLRALLVRIPQLLSWGRGEVMRLRRLAGIAERDEHAVSRLTVFLQDTERTISSLPYVYQELYRIAPLTESRFFTGRESELAALNEVVQAWEEGRVASTAVIGEQGSGRTTLLQIARGTLFTNHNIVERTLTGSLHEEPDLSAALAEDLGLERTDSLATLEQAILSSDIRQVCVVENIQHLFLRTVDGFDLLERFLLLVATTGRQILWVLSCTLNSWQYLDRVLAISGFVHTVIRLDSLSEEHVRGIIDRRHTVSGFRRVFELSESDRALRRVKRTRSVTQRQEVAEDLFFERLQDIAAGNVAVALLFYLRSVVRVKGDTLVFTTDLHLDEEALLGLGAEERFTLAAVVIHDGLTEDEHARVFRQSREESRQVLSRLWNQGILIDREGDFRLHPTLHRPILRALRQVNILH